MAPTLAPSGDATGARDTKAINSAMVEGASVVLGAGNWHVTNVGLTVNDCALRGQGPPTKIHVLDGHDGLTVTGPGRIMVRDFSLYGGRYGIVVNGAYDAHFSDLYLSLQTAGGVKINGDLATEQHWTDITMRTVGGIGFDVERATSEATGSLYLARVRIVTPPPTATGGFRFNAMPGDAALNTAFMDQCVADGYSNDAYSCNNMAQVFVSNCWFALVPTANTGQVAMRIIGGLQQTYNGCYAYTGSPTGMCVLVSGDPRGIYIGGGHVFDGEPGAMALGLAGMTSSGFRLGEYESYCGTLTDTPSALKAI